MLLLYSDCFMFFDLCPTGAVDILGAKPVRCSGAQDNEANNDFDMRNNHVSSR